MGCDIIRAQKPDDAVHLDAVFVPEHTYRMISRLREVGHVPYRCTRCYKTKPNGGET